MKLHKEDPVNTPVPATTPVEMTYVFTGEKNYEPPKPDPWIEEEQK